MQPSSAFTDTADWYEAFARQAAGSSPTYEAWSRAIAEDDEVLRRVDELPRERRQPNLVLAAARALGMPAGTWPEVRPWLLDAWPRVAEMARRRTTQTNEAGRCAVLLPALAHVPGPIALVEVGASAGLCLHPDRYAYAYRDPTGATTTVGDASDVVLRCRLEGEPGEGVAWPPPLPRVAWRAGLDLSPLDPGDPEDVAWLSALVWPEHDERRARLLAAARAVAGGPARVERGDALRDLDAVLDRVPAGLTPVVVHSAVLAYLGPDDRAAFAAAMRRRRADGVRWISNEGRDVLPDVAARLPAGTEVGARFVVALDGLPLGLAGQHGESYAFLPAASGG